MPSCEPTPPFKGILTVSGKLQPKNVSVHFLARLFLVVRTRSVLTTKFIESEARQIRTRERYGEGFWRKHLRWAAEHVESTRELRSVWDSLKSFRQWRAKSKTNAAAGTETFYRTVAA